MYDLFEENHPFVIYRSSAGSGKTYTLTREYLTLAMRQGHTNAYKRILAVTFTNKAMQEMKDRIVQKLFEFSQGRLDSMADEIMTELECSKKELSVKSNRLLSKILHEYSHFAVTTIDAFFQQVLRSFSRELQVGGNYRLELDQDLVYQKVVESLLADLRKNKEVKKWVLQFSMTKLDEGKGWEVDRELVNFLKELDKETFRKFDDKLWRIGGKRIDTLTEYTNAIIHAVEKRMKDQAKRASKILQQYTLAENDLRRGIHSTFTKIERGEFLKEAPGKTVMKALGEDDWHKKDHARANQIHAALDAGYRDCLAEVVRIYEEENLNYQTARAIRRNIYLFALSHALLLQLKNHKKENDILFVSDATIMLKGLIRESDAPFIYEKVGGFFNNFLIDEFQDTSEFQWESFFPLIENSLSEGQRCLIVGDVKQSIYRWRGGDLKLLHSKAEQSLSMFGVETQRLDTNYRSAENIIRFNNQIFSNLPELLDRELPGSPVLFQGIYEDVVQHVPNHRQNGEGYVEFQFLPSRDFEASALERMLEILKYLQDRGVALKDTAILVRRNIEAKRISDFLLDYRATHPDSKYSFEIVSSESLHLSTSPAVNCLVAAIRFVNNPTDSLNAAAVKRFLFEIQGSDKSLEDFLIHGSPALISELQDSATRYQRMPLYSLIEALISLLKLREIDGEIPYILTFQDQVLNYSKNGKGDISGLLELWEDKLHKESIQVSSDLDAIRIMTIHKVKGLEFHSVIMPFVNWTVSSNLGGAEWFHYSLQEDEFILPLNYTSKLAETAFAEAYHEEEANRYLDHLNMLYVAFTRAAHDLWCISTERDKYKRVSNLLLDVLSQEELRDMNQSHSDGMFTFGSREFSYDSQEHTGSEREKLPYYACSEWQSRLTLKQAPKRIRQEERQISMSVGIIIHDILSSIKSLEDVKTILSNTRYSSGMDHSHYEHILEKVRLAFEVEEIRRWFDNKWVVKNEATIFCNGEEYRPDRVVVSSDEVLIIDYKTGAKKKADVAQMKHYISLLSSMYTQHVEGRILYLENLEILEVK